MALGFDDAVPDGVANEIGDAAEAELPEQAGAVGFRGADTDAQGAGDLFVRAAMGEEAREVAFARRKAGFRAARFLAGFGGEKTGEKDAGDFGSEEGAVLGDGANGGAQVAGGVAFPDVTFGAGFEKLREGVSARRR